MSTSRLRITPSERAALPDPRPARMNGGICGFCFIGTESSHDHCRRAIRNGNGSIFFCECLHPSHGVDKVTPRCTECYNAAEGEIDTKLWLCLDVQECEARIRARLHEHPTYQMIESIRERAEERMVAEGKRKPKRDKAPARPKTGNCLCCGEATSGGKFLPGHDARLVSIWSKKVAANEATAEDAITKFVELGTSDALVAKLKRKLEAVA